MNRLIKTLHRRGGILISSLLLIAAGLTPGVALAQSPPMTVYLNYGTTTWGYTLISIDTIFCDYTTQHALINFGTITNTEVRNYPC